MSPQESATIVERPVEVQVEVGVDVGVDVERHVEVQARPQEPAPPRREVVFLRVREGAGRCAWCHALLEPEEGERCTGCNTRRHPECVAADPACPTYGCRRVGLLVEQRWQWRISDRPAVARSGPTVAFWRASAVTVGVLTGLVLPVLLLTILAVACAGSTPHGASWLAVGRSIEVVIGLGPLYAWALGAYTAALCGGRGRVVAGGVGAGALVALWYALVEAQLLDSLHVHGLEFGLVALFLVGPALVVAASYAVVLALVLARARPPLVIRVHTAGRLD